MTEKATAQDVIDTLRSIDASLKLLVGHFGCVKMTTTVTNSAIPRIAPDNDLDGKYGDPTIRAKDPRDWTGDSMLGRPMSECPPEYLEMVADRLDYFNSTETDEKKRKYQALDASRARGWAQRKRNGWQPPAQAPVGFPSDAPMVDEDSIPF